MRTVALAIVICVCAAAAAGPLQFETYSNKTISVALPKGWSVHEQGGAIVAQRDPNRAESASRMVVAQATGVTATEDQLLDAIAGKMAKDVKVTARAPIAGGHGHTMIAD